MTLIERTAASSSDGGDGDAGAGAEAGAAAGAAAIVSEHRQLRDVAAIVRFIEDPRCGSGGVKMCGMQSFGGNYNPSLTEVFRLRPPVRLRGLRLRPSLGFRGIAIGDMRCGLYSLC